MLIKLEANIEKRKFNIIKTDMFESDIKMDHKQAKSFLPVFKNTNCIILMEDNDHDTYDEKFLSSYRKEIEKKLVPVMDSLIRKFGKASCGSVFPVSDFFIKKI